MLRKILLMVVILSAGLFVFPGVSEAQSDPTKTRSEPDKTKPNIIALKSGEPGEF